jgi:mono/diheme cytochrome c family protein
MHPPVAVNTAGKLDEEIAALDALGGKTVDPTTVSVESRSLLDAFLRDTFGTPAAPHEVSPNLKLTTAHLTEGSKLFKRHCLQCHNLGGDGRGQGGMYVVPFPRDYRQGAFKFVSSRAGGKPRRTDLLQTLHDGLKGTAMPSFSLLPQGDRDLLTGYVAYLSIRGEVEFDTLRALSGARPIDSTARLKEILAEWEAAEVAPPIPSEPLDGEPGTPAHDAAIRHGHSLFTEKRDDACISCHGNYGRKPVLRYDVWGTVAKPANLTEPQLKGGARAGDLFARIRFGIAPVGMPAHAAEKYSERDIWDLVRFVAAAPYPGKLPIDVRVAVYPNP